MTAPVTAYRDDAEILQLATQDGCSLAMREALVRLDGRMTALIAHRRVYLVHAEPGDSGFSCFEVADPTDMPILLLKLAPLLGSAETIRIEAHEGDPGAPGTRH
jgi:hypothetical protein